MPTAAKSQRWTDLIAALLRRQGAVDFATIRREVPAYAGGTSDDSVLRMFERDKDELRAMGVPIESVRDEDGNLSRYRLASRHFYLPYLRLSHDAARPPRRPGGPGYGALPVLAFEPDELDAIARAAHRVADVGDGELTAAAMLGLRKLGHDLPVPGRDSGEHLAVERRVDATVLDLLSDALRRRKRVRFTYRSMHRDAEQGREVEPYGLAFLSGHWYLIARDIAADGIRQFRVSRIAEPAVNAKQAQTADYAVPPTFDLGKHAASRHAWEIGDAEPVTVTVRFVAETGITWPAMQLGTPVPGDPQLRRFQVRRADTFARWILGFAGDARIVEPTEVADRFRELVRQTLAVYGVQR